MIGLIRISLALACASSLALYAPGTQATEMHAPSAEDCAVRETQAEMTACFGVRLKAAEAALEQALLELMVRIDEGSEAERLLEEAEEAWGAYRDKHCAFVASGGQGGSAQPMALSMCLTDVTEARTHELRKQLSCGEGDLSCATAGAQ